MVPLLELTLTLALGDPLTSRSSPIPLGMPVTEKLHDDVGQV